MCAVTSALWTYEKKKTDDNKNKKISEKKIHKDVKRERVRCYEK